MRVGQEGPAVNDVPVNPDSLSELNRIESCGLETPDSENSDPSPEQKGMSFDYPLGHLRRWFGMNEDLSRAGASKVDGLIETLLEYKHQISGLVFLVNSDGEDGAFSWGEAERLSEILQKRYLRGSGYAAPKGWFRVEKSSNRDAPLILRLELKSLAGVERASVASNEEIRDAVRISLGLSE